MAARPRFSLVLSDVDGTLVTPDKVVTPRAREAVERLRREGIRFAVTSGRPPRGLATLIDALALDTPVSAFNGGTITAPDLKPLVRRALPADVAIEAVRLLREHGLDPWVYDGTDWLVTRGDAPHVEREAHTVGFAPTVTASLDEALGNAVKIVGVSDDRGAVRACEAAARAALGDRASASCSQPYYLDVTHRDSNKGAVVDYLASSLGVPRERIATIGDGPNDVAMFRCSGLGIAMGNASEEVRTAAAVTTDANDADGFAKAMERWILGTEAIPRAGALGKEETHGDGR